MGLFDTTTTSTTTEGFDPNSQDAINRMRAAGRHLAGLLGGSGSMYADAINLGDIQGFMPGLMNPYTQQVIGGLGQQFDDLRKQASLGVGQQATSSGAFGGSRHGILEAERLAALDKAQAQQVGGLLSGQYNQALQQAMGLAQAQQGVAQQRAMEPFLRAQMQQQALSNIGPTGRTVTQSETQGGSTLGGLLGLGTSLASTFLNPAGAAMGAMGSLPGLGGSSMMQGIRNRGLFGFGGGSSPFRGSPSPFSMASNPYPWGSNPFSITNR
jgi:hypothetical protein